MRVGVISLAGLLTVAGLMALGLWQVERRAWKLDLIQRVAARMAQEAQPPPGPATWGHLDRQNAEYRRVRTAGTYLAGDDVLVQAVTVLGSGYWVLTPLRTAQGFIVLINRGFVPMDRRDAVSRRAPDGVVTVDGLLRFTEPTGGFLHHNDAAARRWYSRDVQAISNSLALTDVAPYFLDAGNNGAPPTAGAPKSEPMGAPKGEPISGLTVVHFSNNHLQYAVTWFLLALMTLAALAWFWRQEWRLRRA